MLVNINHRAYRSLKYFLRSESGATAIEYGMIAAGISIVIVGGVILIGQSVGLLFNSVANALN